MRYEFVLPYPPTINTYWRKFRNRIVISKKGQAFRSAVCLTLMRARVRPLEGSLVLKIRLYPPDKRKRDIDNIQKPLLDALEKGGAFYNDCQIKHLTTVMLESVQGGKTVVCIKTLKKAIVEAEIK